MKRISILAGFLLLVPGSILLEADTFASQANLLPNSNSADKLIAQLETNAEDENLSNSEPTSVSVGDLNLEYTVVEKFADGYKIELNAIAEEEALEWEASLYLPEGHEIVENYGVLVSSPSDTLAAHNFKGDEWNQDLSAGESATAVLIVKGDPSRADVSFDSPDPRLGEPTVSSFTEEDRRQWQEENLASQENLSVSDEEAEPSNFSEEAALESDWVDSDNSNLPQESVQSAQTSSGEGQESSVSNPQGEDNLEDFSEEEALEIERVTSPERNEDRDINREAGLNPEEAASEPSSEPEPNVAEDVVSVASPSLENQGAVSGSANFNYAEALQKSLIFFDANKSGPLGNNNRFQWRSDSTLNDGADVGRDLTGGYFDAGDHIKFIQPMAFTSTMLAWSGVDYKQAYVDSGQLDELQANVRWATDYFLKCHETNGSATSKLWVQVGDREDHNHWVTPEQIDQKTARPSFAIDANSPGADVAAGTASALASASMLFAGTDDAYSQELLQNAIALFDFAEAYPGKYSDSVSAVNPFYTSWSGYEDELVLGAMWLYRATGDATYLSKAENYYKQGIGHIGTYTYSTDDHSYAGLALLARESSDPFFKQEFGNWASNWLNGTGGVNYSDGGFAVRAEWASAPLALGAAYLAEWYNDFVEPNQDLARFAQQQLDYVLGKNPLGYSYVIGFGDAYPTRPHHRGSAGSVPMDNSDRPNDNLLVGALVGGPRNTDNSHEDRRDDWVTNEVGTSYNAPLTANAIQQFENHGGQPIGSAELSNIAGIK